jgi:hypothetical protein
MKTLKSIFILSLIVMSAASCSNDDNDAINRDSDYFMSFEVNGSKILYTDLLAAEFNYIENQGLYGLTIAGANFTGPNLDEDFGIILIDDKEISTSTYSQEVNPNTYNSEALISYIKSGEGYSSAHPILSNEATATASITNITSTFIEGTFSGNLVNSSGDYNTITHIVKNGKFKIKIGKIVQTTGNNQNEPNGDYFMKFKINDEPVNYNHVLKTNINQNPKGPSNALFYGMKSNGAFTYSSISLTVIPLNDTQIGKTTYTNPTIYKNYDRSGLPIHPLMHISLQLSASQIYLATSATISITSLQNDYITGTFSAELVNAYDLDTVTHVISNGEFKIKRE